MIQRIDLEVNKCKAMERIPDRDKDSRRGEREGRLRGGGGGKVGRLYSTYFHGTKENVEICRFLREGLFVWRATIQERFEIDYSFTVVVSIENNNLV